MRCYLLGAGFAKPAGGPLVRDMLDESYTRWLTQPQRERLEDLKRRVGDEEYALQTIETIWGKIDQAAADEKGEAYGLSGDALRSTSDLLLDVHHRVMDGYQRELMNGIQDVFVSEIALLESVPRSKVLAARSFVVDPHAWFGKETRGWQPADRAAALSALAGTVASERPRAVAATLQRNHWPAEHADRLALELDRLSRQQLRRRAGHARLREFVGHANRIRALPWGKDLLGDPHGEGDAKSIDTFLFRLHMTDSPDGVERIRSVAGWMHAVCGLMLSLRPGDAVVTTNYDLLVELAKWILPRDMVGSIGPLHLGTDYWIATWHGGQAASYRVSEPCMGGVSLLKLHGSLAWKLCMGCGELTSSDAFRVASQPGEPSRAQCCQAKTRPAVRLMVPPRTGKEYSSQPLRSIWSSAQHAIAVNDQIICVGHSLLRGDAELYRLISDARQARGSDWHSITVVNWRSSSELMERYREAFGQAVKPIWLSADDYFAQTWVGELSS